MTDLFLIVNCLNPDNSVPLCYSPVRSIFSAQERLDQLHQTIKSIQEKKAGDIVLLECSRLSEEQREFLSRENITVLDYSTDEEIFSQSISPYKGPTELLVLKKFFTEEIIEKSSVGTSEKSSDKSSVKYSRFFKVSGRYSLTEDFSKDIFSTEKITMRLFPWGSISTVLFCIPREKILVFLQDTEQTLAKTRNFPISVESVAGKTLTDQDVMYVNYVGICGKVSVDGSTAIH